MKYLDISERLESVLYSLQNGTVHKEAFDLFLNQYDEFLQSFSTSTAEVSRTHLSKKQAFDFKMCLLQLRQWQKDLNLEMMRDQLYLQQVVDIIMEVSIVIIETLAETDIKLEEIKKMDTKHLQLTDKKVAEITLPFSYGVNKEDGFSYLDENEINVRIAKFAEKFEDGEIGFVNEVDDYIMLSEIYENNTRFTDGKKTAYLSNRTFENLVAQVKEENAVNIENVKEKICEVFELEDLQINDQNLEMIEHFIEITNKTIEPKLSDTTLNDSSEERMIMKNQ